MACHGVLGMLRLTALLAGKHDGFNMETMMQGRIAKTHDLK